MRPVSTYRVLLSLGSALMFTGCIATVRARPGVLYVQQAPPPRLVEVIGPPPSPNHIWIAGHHEWRGREYVWVAGRFEVIPPGFGRYEQGKWMHERAGWFWQEGRWR